MVQFSNANGGMDSWKPFQMSYPCPILVVFFYLPSGDPLSSLWSIYGKTVLGRIKTACCPPEIIVSERVPTFHCFQMLQNILQANVVKIWERECVFVCMQLTQLCHYGIIKEK